MTGDGRHRKVEGPAAAGVFAAARDVTARKRIEEEPAKQTLRRLAQFPDENPNPVLRVGTDGALLYANRPAQAWLAAMGWAADGLLPAEIGALVADAAGRTGVVQAEVHDRKARTYWVNAVQPAGESYVNLYALDITERKQVEQALRESQERLQTTLDASRVGWWRLDLVSGEAQADGRCKSLFGLDENATVSMPEGMALIHPEDRPRIEKRLTEVVKEPGDYEDVFRVLGPDGQTRWLLARGRVFHAGGQPSHVTGVLLDITDRKQVEEKERQSREDLDHAQAVGHVGSWRLDVERNVLTWSDENHRIFGIPKGTPMTYETFLGVVHPDDRQYVDSRWKAGLAGEPYDIEHRIVVDGAIKWVREKAYLEFDDVGKLLGGFGITQDITERKEAEAAILASKQQWERTFDAVPDLIAILDEQHRIRQVNKAMARRLGFAPDQCIAQKCYEVVHGATCPPGFCPHVLTAKDGKEHVAEIHEDRLGGDFLVSTTPLHDAEGRMIGSVHVARDITERKQAEFALRQARDELEQRVKERTAELAAANELVEAERQRLYDVLESLPAYVVLLSRDYHVPFANRFFEERFGKSNGRRCFEYLFHRTEPCENCESFKPFKTCAPHHWEWSGPDGCDYDITDIPFTDTDGSPMIMEMGIDVTERKRAEETLRQRTEQLRALASQLTLAEQRERLRLARVLHDGLQQVLVGARYRLSVLEAAGSEEVRRAAAEVSDLVAESIEMSRSLTADLSPPILHESGLVPALEWLVRWMKDRHGLSVDLQARGEIQPAEDITILLFQATRELLFNVVKHAGIRKATVEVSRGDGQIHISVADEGGGFDVNNMRTYERQRGGFGLFTIRERLGLLGGRLEIDSAPGRGSRFSVVAPLAALPQEAAVARPDRVPLVSVVTTTRPSPAAASAAKKIRVVLVDDHVVMRQGLSALLRTQGDIEIIGEASDGRSAVELVKHVRPDVVIMDVSMPGMNGIDATRIIHAELPDVPVIGLSMYQEAELAKAMRQAGAVNYLTKSGPCDELVAAIRACVQSQPADAPDQPKPDGPARRQKTARRRPTKRSKG